MLQYIDNYITELVGKIKATGATKLKNIVDIYKNNQDKLLEGNTGGDDSDVEKQLQQIEKQRSMV